MVRLYSAFSTSQGTNLDKMTHYALLTCTRYRSRRFKGMRDQRTTEYMRTLVSLQAQRLRAVAGLRHLRYGIQQEMRFLERRRGVTLLAQECLAYRSCK